MRFIIIESKSNKSYPTSVNSLYQNNKLKKQLNKHEYGELVSLFAHSHYCNESNQNNQVWLGLMTWKRVSFEFELNVPCNSLHTIYVYKGSSQ